MSRRLRWVSGAVISVAVLGIGGLWVGGSIASAPAPAHIGAPPDLHATLAEMKLIYANANSPKELWVIPGARHQDFHHYARAEYERRVVEFFRAKLRN